MTRDNESGHAQGQETLLDSTLDSVDAAEAAVLAYAEQLGMDEDNRHQLGMAVRESMVNAVVHGNRYNLNKHVHLALSAEPDQMVVVIGDEGDGFDLSDLPDPLHDDNLLRQSGRGILLIQAFVDEFQLHRREPRGTEVKLVKHLQAAE